MSNEERKKKGVGIYILCTCRREMEGLNKRAAPIISSQYYRVYQLIRPSPFSRIDTETGCAYSVLYKSKLSQASPLYMHVHMSTQTHTAHTTIMSDCITSISLFVFHLHSQRSRFFLVFLFLWPAAAPANDTHTHKENQKGSGAEAADIQTAVAGSFLFLGSSPGPVAQHQPSTSTADVRVQLFDKIRRQAIFQEPQEKEKEIDKLENVEQSPFRFYFYIDGHEFQWITKLLVVVMCQPGSGVRAQCSSRLSFLLSNERKRQTECHLSYFFVFSSPPVENSLGSARLLLDVCAGPHIRLPPRQK